MEFRNARLARPSANISGRTNSFLPNISIHYVFITPWWSHTGGQTNGLRKRSAKVALRGRFCSMTDRNRLLELALKGLEAERAQVENEISQIRSQLGYRSTNSNNPIEGTTLTGRKRRKMSAAAKKKISEGMKRRYAELRKAAKRA